MTERSLENIIDKFLTGDASLDELNQLDQWYNSFDTEINLYEPGPELDEKLKTGFSELKLKLGFD